MMKMKVIIESPYAGYYKSRFSIKIIRIFLNWIFNKIIVYRNINYARACMKDCFIRHEAPFISHLIYTQILNDNKSREREQGIEAGLLWGKCADKTVVYCDYGISPGMKKGIERAEKEGRKIEYRKLYK